ncbi:MAG: hypothetical protein R2799_06860 [Crocinitomicaceae bacterium]
MFNSRISKLILMLIGYFYLITTISKYRENDSYFYIGLAVLTLYTIFAYKIVESMDDSDQENDQDFS